jgi:hypothetical protein
VAYPPTTITITRTGGSDVLKLPAGVGYYDFVSTIVRSGGYWLPQNPSANPSDSLTFTPVSQIKLITAQ